MPWTELGTLQTAHAHAEEFGTGAEQGTRSIKPSNHKEHIRTGEKVQTWSPPYVLTVLIVSSLSQIASGIHRKSQYG